MLCVFNCEDHFFLMLLKKKINFGSRHSLENNKCDDTVCGL